jgi:hypothetical protein
LGLPEVIVNFISAAQTAVLRSQQGIVALILRDETLPSDKVPKWGATTAYTAGQYVIPSNGSQTWFYKCTTAGNSAAAEPAWPIAAGATVNDGTVVWTAVQPTILSTYNTIDDVASTDWTAANYDLISKTFLGAPYKVMIVRGDTTDADYSNQLALLATIRWNYLAIPGIASADVAAVSAWIKDQRDNKRKTYKAVLPVSTSDHEGIIDFETTGITVGATVYTTAQYTGRIAGILAGMPQTRSSTFYVLTEIDSITQSADPDADIDAGKLILINDGEQIKIARGVNSLVTLTAPKNDDWQKIKIIDGHDLVQDDIQNTFSDEYIGQVNNDYDNQAIFIAATNVYLGQLGGTVLDPNGTNSVDVDVQAQRQAWQNAGTDTSSWSDQKVKETAFQSRVFLTGSAKFLDAMEDLQLNIAV